MGLSLRGRTMAREPLNLIDRIAPGDDVAPDGAGFVLGPQDALALWRVAIVASVRAGGHDLSARQMALLLTVYQTQGPHTVRGLASGLRISKPAVTRALDALGQKGLLRRKRDEADLRNVLVQRTVKGSVFLTEFAERIMAAGRAL
jgi:DNA-binding MarR family transcriptional regulator